MKRYYKLIILSFFFFVHSNVFSQEEQPKNGKLSEGLQAYEENGKMGFKDAHGTVVLKPKFKTNLFSDLPFFKEFSISAIISSFEKISFVVLCVILLIL